MHVIFSWLQRNLVVVSVILLTITFLAALITITDDRSFQTSPIDVWIHTDTVKQNVSPNFLSLALSAGLLKSDKFESIINSPQILRLAKHLSPGFLRIGGNEADLLTFDENGTEEEAYQPTGIDTFDLDDCSYESSSEWCLQLPLIPVVMTGRDWLAINSAAKAAGLTVLFDLNALKRTNTGAWNSSNAKNIIKFSVDNNITAVWQLGNEPNSYPHKFGVRLPPRQLGRDFRNLRTILDSAKFKRKPQLVGPDVTRPRIHLLKLDSTSYLKEFLSVAWASLDAVTWHQYYFSGKTAKINDFLNISHFDYLREQIREVKEIVDRVPSKKIWLSETSTAYGGGAPGLSDRFVATFLWLDKLGVSARYGIDVVIKQTLFGGHYGLIDEVTLQPLPIWWVSLLHKQLVGTEVLPVYTPLAPPELRLYAHRSAKTAKDVVLFGVNLDERKSKFIIQHNCSEKIRLKKYVLTAPGGDLTSKDIFLNGNLLRLEPNGSIPVLAPETETSDIVTLPGYSIIFIVIKKDC